MGKKVDRAYLMWLTNNGYENKEIATLTGATENTVSLALAAIKAEWAAKRRPRKLELGDDYIKYKRKGG